MGRPHRRAPPRPGPARRKGAGPRRGGHVRAHGRRAEVVGSDGKNTYHLRYVEATGTWLCTCPAFLYRPHMIGQTAYCKHTLARAIAERAGMIKEN